MSKAQGTALVTGASSGIGAVYADRLAHRGYDLVLVARDAKRMEVLAQRLRGETGRTIEVLPADLTVRADLARVEQRVAAADVTLLVNNAGMTLNGSVLENGPAAIEQILAVNVTAPTLLAAAAAKAFVARKAGGIINIASVLAVAPELFDGIYSGTKAHLLALSQKLALDVLAHGVRVQAVLPGATRTEIWQRAGMDAEAMMPGMIMEAGDLVEAALAGYDKGETVTIPPLADEGQWAAFETARKALAPNLSRREVAPRYREKIAA